ncbi:sensor histidine kinase [Oscillibacter sp.]|uniref:cache domain-containing sensor histidine kinase n=1 Tax=Oscillibacter sp. TaxID=1945593 RepID=UPI0028AF86EE|nr:sensor histidine kinase [Oscillibacter sp.]
MSFKQKLILMGVIPIVLLGSLMGWLSFRHARDTVIASQKGVVADTVYRIDVNLNTKVRYIVESVRSAANSAAVADLIEEPQSSAAQQELRSYASGLSRDLSAVSSVSLLTREDLVFSTVDTTEVRLNSAIWGTYLQNAWERPNKVHWSSLSSGLYRASGREGVSHFISAYSAVCDRTGTAVGLLVVEMSPDSFSSLLLDNQNLLKYQYTYIVGRDGQVICSDKRVNVRWRSLINERFYKGDRRFTFQWEGEDYYVCGQYNALTGWRTFSVISVANLFPQARSLQTYSFLLVVFSVLLMLCCILLMYRSITQPLSSLNKAMKVVQEKNFELRLPNARTDEIGALTDSFNQMVNKINSLIREVYQEKLAQKNAELEALQTQINPHFLYNTLDSINWMAIERGDTEISRIIIALGKLMQYSMDTEQSQATLEQEYAYLQDYLCIQKNRLEDKLSYELQLDDRVRTLLVPKLILQPLVENAIKHGIEPSCRCGTVRVFARPDGSSVLITVEDDGCGMNASQLALAQECCSAESSAGIGLRNVARRLKLFFGEDSVLTIQPGSQGGTMMTLRLPGSLEEDSHENSDY